MRHQHLFTGLSLALFFMYPGLSFTFGLANILKSWLTLSVDKNNANSLTLQDRVSTDSATLESKLTLPCKVEHTHTLQLSNSHPRTMP